jgi:hypothetical protein
MYPTWYFVTLMTWHLIMYSPRCFIVHTSLNTRQSSSDFKVKLL